ncbi:hypothetical protein WA158_000910 [Blastocystis sp. Blastoise]
MGRQPANTKLGAKRIYLARGLGGNLKHRAIRLDTGSFSWAGEAMAETLSRILDVMYNSSNNELVRTKTLVKGCIVAIDALPFKQWFEKHYGVTFDTKSSFVVNAKTTEGKCKATARKYLERRHSIHIPKELMEQIASGRVLAAISSRPGQSGRADGEELNFYKRKISLKRK